MDVHTGSISMLILSSSKIKPPADCRGAQKKNVMQSMTRTSQQVRQGVLESYKGKCRMEENEKGKVENEDCKHNRSTGFFV